MNWKLVIHVLLYESVVLMKVAKKYAGGLFNGSEVLMSTCIYKQNREGWRLQMLIYGAVSIALYRDMDEFDCVHTFNVLSDMFM